MWVTNDHQLRGAWEPKRKHDRGFLFLHAEKATWASQGHWLFWQYSYDHWLADVMWSFALFIFFMNLVARENQVVSKEEKELILEQCRSQTKAGILLRVQPQGNATGRKGKKPGQFFTFKYCFVVLDSNINLLWAEIAPWNTKQEIQSWASEAP